MSFYLYVSICANTREVLETKKPFQAVNATLKHVRAWTKLAAFLGTVHLSSVRRPRHLERTKV